MNNNNNFMGGGRTPFLYTRPIAAVTVFFILCTVFFSCGGGGGGGGGVTVNGMGGGTASGRTWANSSGGSGESVSIHSGGGGSSSGTGGVQKISFKESASLTALGWTQMDLTVYVNGTPNTFTVTPDAADIEFVAKNGDTVHVEATVYDRAGTRRAATDTITLGVGSNPLTMYIEYNITFDINATSVGGVDLVAPFAEFEGSVQTKTGIYTTRSFGAPTHTITDTMYSNYKIVGWATDPSGTPRFVPGTTKGDQTVYAVWQAGEIEYTQAYYNATPTGTYIVNSLTQFMDLVALSKTNNFENRTIKINTNLTLPATFTGLGPDTDVPTLYFKGTIDGKGSDGVRHPITVNTNLSTDTEAAGFVTYLDTVGRIENLTLNGSMNVKATYCGGIAVHNMGTILQCVNNATITNSESSSSTAGIVSWNAGSISKCYNTGNISNTTGTATIRVGGICGFNGDIIDNVYNTGTITGNTTATDNDVGYLVGYMSPYATLRNAYTTGTLTAGSRFICARKSDPVTVTDCYCPSTSNEIISDVDINSNIDTSLFPSIQGWTFSGGLPKFNF